MKFLLSARQSFAVSDPAKLPPHYFPHRIRAATPYYFKNGFGDFFVQIITGRGFSVQFNIFDILKKKCLYPYTSRPVITLHFMLKGDVHCFLNGFGEAWLREGLYHLFYVPGKVRHRAWFEPGAYHSFHIDLSPQYLRRLSARYPEVKEALDRWRQHSISGLQQHTARITREVAHLIEELKHCPYQEEPDKSWYLETRIRELLRLYVHDMPTEERLLSLIGSRMEKIKYYIDSRLKEHLTIPGVAKHFHIGSTTFKRWFVRYFGKPFHQYLLEQRMQYAQTLLQDTDRPISDIAEETGYSDTASFSHAFTRYTKHAPGYYRQR
ncbi:MAG: AraC family transcriptional regulator [Chitinophagaceae bacterium]|nr:MAG: AraC family transcriptional regulator [Chitinophagaceae bacterium]